MSSQKNKAEQQQRMLEEFLRLKPTRAIDRLLNEYNLDRAHSVYNTLQQKIRKNTSDLRATLTEKYQNLVDCSNLLTTIQAFTQQIEAIAADINKTFNRGGVDAEQGKKTNRNPIGLIEQQIHRKKYSLAMKYSYVVKVEQLQVNQIQYLPFLRIQILEALEKQLICKKISQSFIVEVVSCLQTFIDHLPNRDYRQICRSKFQEGSLISLISQCLSSKNTQGISEAQILQILFECKLFSLNRSVKQAHQYDKITKFFHDILQLLAEQDRQSGSAGQLATIFCNNLSQIEAHLSETFIKSNSKQIIQFRYDLYEQLLSSEEFVLILRKLHHIISQNEAVVTKISLHQSFLNLWNNYYRELLTLLFNKCNPILQLDTQSAIQNSIPRQLAKYTTNNERSIENILKQYRIELELFFNNIQELLSKAHQLADKAISKDTSLEQIKSQYQTNIDALNSNINAKMLDLSNNPSQFNLRATILLCLLCNQFNFYVKQNCTNNRVLSSMTDFRLNFNQNAIRKHSAVFSKGKSKNWTINFDHFFMYYAGIANSNRIQIVRASIMSIIEQMMLEKAPDQGKKCIEQQQQKKKKQQSLYQLQKGKLRDVVVTQVGVAAFSKKKGLVSQR